AMAALLLRGKVTETESPVIRSMRAAYLPTLRWALSHRRMVLALTGVVLLVSAVVASRLGGEFVPALDERDILVQPLRLPGISVDEAVTMQHGVETVIASMPEVKEVFSR